MKIKKEEWREGIGRQGWRSALKKYSRGAPDGKTGNTLKAGTLVNVGVMIGEAGAAFLAFFAVGGEKAASSTSKGSK